MQSMLYIAAQHKGDLMQADLYFDDYAIGETLLSDSYQVDEKEAITFASAYDPQIQHIDAQAAKQSAFGELVVSGWHTAAISMRLKLQTKLGRVSGGLVGMGLESVRWLKPVKPGDSLKIRVTITDKRRSHSKPNKGIVKYDLETLNQRDEVVMDLKTAVIMPVS
jgi:acyl dehydratase